MFIFNIYKNKRQEDNQALRNWVRSYKKTVSSEIALNLKK